MHFILDSKNQNSQFKLQLITAGKQRDREFEAAIRIMPTVRSTQKQTHPLKRSVCSLHFSTVQNPLPGVGLPISVHTTKITLQTFPESNLNLDSPSQVCSDLHPGVYSRPSVLTNHDSNFFFFFLDWEPAIQQLTQWTSEIRVWL